MLKSSKKSQLTVFILMAVAALAIFGLVYFSRGQATQTKIQAEEEKLITNKMAASQVEFFVQQCLEKSFQEGIELITKQGGYIMQEQRGSMIPFAIPYINYTADNKTYLVAYRSTRDQKDLLPKYPCLHKDDSPEPRFCGYINDETQYISLSNHTYGLTKNIVTDGAGSYLTIQKQLERYVENQTLECINFSSFSGFNATFENATATVTIQDEQASVTLFIPIIVLIQDVSPVIQKFKFSSVQRIRLKKVHNAAQELLSFDNRDIDFRLKEDGVLGRFKSNVFRVKDLNLEIEKISNAKKSDDIFIFTDTKSTLAGKPLKYIIARENRMPALNLILPNSRNPNYDVLISPGQKLEFKPLAFDPDEDAISYSYDGFSDDDKYLEQSKKIAEALAESMKDQESDCKNRCSSYEVTSNDEGEYIITVKASDGEFTDFQNIRVKVISSILAVPNVYNFYTEKLIGSQKSWQSAEDPVFFDATGSVLPEADAEYNYIWVDSYKDQKKIDAGLPEDQQTTDKQITTDATLKEKCLVKFGNVIKPCDDPSLILDIKKPIALNPTQAIGHEEEAQFSFDAVKVEDYYTHNITLGIKLISGEQSQDSIETTDIKVKECLPYKVTTGSTSDYPNFKQTYPFMYARKKTDKDYWTADIYTLSTASENDFMGAHTAAQSRDKVGCCTKDGERKLQTELCFEYTATFYKTDLEKFNFDAVEILKTQLIEDSTAGNGALTVITKKLPDKEPSCTETQCEVSFKQYCGQRGNACSGRIEWEIVNP